VVSELRRYSGSQFDSAVVDAFLQSGAVRNFLDTRRGDHAWFGVSPRLAERDQRVVAG